MVIDLIECIPQIVAPSVRYMRQGIHSRHIILNAHPMSYERSKNGMLHMLIQDFGDDPITRTYAQTRKTEPKGNKINDLMLGYFRETGERPYPCARCGKRFSRQCNRNTHYRIHFEPVQKPHKCLTCDAAFASWALPNPRIGRMTDHYLKMHGLGILPAPTNR